MFDNLGTALIQAVGFFGVFGFFVYQLLSEGKKPNKTVINTSTKKIKKLNDKNDIPKKRGLFGKKIEKIKVEEKPRKKGLFGRKIEPAENLEIPERKGWFR